MKNGDYAYYTEENNDAYRNFRHASQYLADKNQICDPGSGTNVNGALIIAGAGDPWSVSRFGNQLQHVPVQKSQYGNWYVIELREIRDEQAILPVLTTEDKLKDTMRIFGLSISHLANVLCSSRPSVHYWLDGAEPRGANIINRIDQLYQLAQQWKDSSPYHFSPGRLLRQALGNAPSMLQLLEADPINLQEITNSFKQLLELMQRKNEQLERSRLLDEKSELSETEKRKSRLKHTKSVYSASD